MMKRLLTLLYLGAVFFASAQSVSKTVVASGGEALTNGEIQLNLTLGEPLIGGVSNEFTLDQGFWAGSLLVEEVTPEEELGGIVVFPNPVQDELNIVTNGKQVYGLTLFSLDGKMVYRKRVDESVVRHFINASTLSKGMYVLQVFIVGESKEKLFKVIKN